MAVRDVAETRRNRGTHDFVFKLGCLWKTVCSKLCNVFETVVTEHCTFNFNLRLTNSAGVAISQRQQSVSLNGSKMEVFEKNKKL